MPTFEIITADVVDWASKYEGPKFHAVLADPPYGLEFMGKEWDSPQKLWEQGTGFSTPGIGERDTPWPSTYNASAPNLTCETCGGRLRGKKKCKCEEPVWKPLGKRKGETVAAWPPKGNLGGFADGNKPSFARQGDIAGRYQEWCERWATELLNVLYPGALGMYFGGTRTSHRLACGIEDSGMVMWDTIMWLYGTGFPKAQDISKLIDKGVVPTPALDKFRLALVEAREKLNLSRAEVSEKVCGTPSGACWNWESGLRIPTGEHWEKLIEILSLSPEFQSMHDEAEREIVGKGEAGLGKGTPAHEGGYKAEYDITIPGSNKSTPWAGHKTCALKPAVEPILCFKTPMGNNNYAELATKYGSGALNIDAARIPTDDKAGGSGKLNSWRRLEDRTDIPVPPSERPVDEIPENLSEISSKPTVRQILEANNHSNSQLANGRDGETTAEKRYTDEGSTNFAPLPGPRGGDAKGRYPANVVLECTCDTTILADAPICGNVSGQEPSPNLGKNGIYGDSDTRPPFQAYTGKMQIHTDPSCPCYVLDQQTGDLGESKGGWSGSGVRDRGWGMSAREDVTGLGFGDTGGASRFFYRVKASRKEREIGLFGHVPCVKCGRLDSTKHFTPAPTTPTNTPSPTLDPTTVFETTEGKCVRNDHPTVKPIGLCYWLAKLLLPPLGDKPRRILVPFSGSGSEMIACLLAGWDEVVGIEQDPKYRDIATKRCEATLRGEYDFILEK